VSWVNDDLTSYHYGLRLFQIIYSIVYIRISRKNILSFNFLLLKFIGTAEELDGLAVSALRRVIAEVKQRRSVIGWVTKHLLSQAPPCFRRHGKLLVPAAFAVVSTDNPHWVRVVGYGPFSLCVIHKEGLYLSSGDINGLMMIMLLEREPFI
jgi:hypothetical protein